MHREDSLDAFMNATVAELRQDKGDKLQKRLEDKTDKDETRRNKTKQGENSVDSEAKKENQRENQRWSRDE